MKIQRKAVGFLCVVTVLLFFSYHSSANDLTQDRFAALKARILYGSEGNRCWEKVTDSKQIAALNGLEDSVEIKKNGDMYVGQDKTGKIVFIDSLDQFNASLIQSGHTQRAAQKQFSIQEVVKALVDSGLVSKTDLWSADPDFDSQLTRLSFRPQYENPILNAIDNPMCETSALVSKADGKVVYFAKGAAPDLKEIPEAYQMNRLEDAKKAALDIYRRENKDATIVEGVAALREINHPDLENKKSDMSKIYSNHYFLTYMITFNDGTKIYIDPFNFNALYRTSPEGQA